jgi:hypothetical protein
VVGVYPARMKPWVRSPTPDVAGGGGERIISPLLYCRAIPVMNLVTTGVDVILNFVFCYFALLQHSLAYFLYFYVHLHFILFFPLLCL